MKTFRSALVDRGVVLVGLDVPSVDQLDSKTLPLHQALGAHGITILESLELSGVYELLAGVFDQWQVVSQGEALEHFFA
jgi:kynurenine formamidase